ncbi:hypothetical protein JHK82_052332 [Glycine max]|nr:hypothetical protein JHK86_052163 [Glycine max]KAG4926532.1 hypothetical protein JHK85_053018 [Glycine max]KAG5082170.1 hypothetical protein JHK84_052208 [Glycine max]KAG5084935.1 hypothetical protein JHK82_052332 [Glycine max]
MNTESTTTDKRKNDKELSSFTDEMKMTLAASVIKEDLSSEISKFSLDGTQVRSLKKRLIVLDINGLLADVVSPPPKGHKADATIARRAIFKRPSYLEFLEFCFDKFEVGIWSSRMKKNVDRVIDYLMGDMKKRLLFCWDLSHCIETTFKTLENKHKSVVFKDLRKLWDKHDLDLPWEKGYFNESNTLLLDDSPYKALFNPPNTSVFPHTFTYQNESDNSLAEGGELRIYLDGLANAEDMHKYIEEHPFGQEGINETSESWDFYRQGGWENDETVEEAAVREAIEEAGVRGDLMVTWFQDFLGNYEFRSKTLQDECSPEGLCKAAMFALFVKEELESWPEQSTRKRSWLAVSEALANC